VKSAIAIVALALASGCATAGVRDIGPDFEPLRVSFDAAAGHPRLVLFVSPT
jgi:hypothetical protein